MEWIHRAHLRYQRDTDITYKNEVSDTIWVGYVAHFDVSSYQRSYDSWPWKTSEWSAFDSMLPVSVI